MSAATEALADVLSIGLEVAAAAWHCLSDKARTKQRPLLALDGDGFLLDLAAASARDQNHEAMMATPGRRGPRGLRQVIAPSTGCALV